MSKRQIKMINIIDLRFLGTDQTIAAFLADAGNGPVLVETGPHSTLPYLKAGVEALGYRLEDIRHVLVTHIHLDHAGAAWALAEHGASVYVHPQGYRHLLDPSRLMESARRIYLDEMDRLWGDMRAIPQQQLHAVEDNEEVRIAGMTWIARHTPGHAVHHIAWQLGDVLFTGDVAGVKIGAGPVMPPCPPPDINVEDWRNSIRLMRELEPRALYLAHFGEVTDVNTHLDILEKRLLDWAEWIRPHVQQGNPLEQIVPLFQKMVSGELEEAGITGGKQLARYEHANPAFMSAAGLARYWKKKQGL